MGRYLRGSAVIGARVAAMVPAIVLVTSTVTGWLYWVRAGVARWPGPRVATAWAVAAGTGLWLLAVDTFSLLVVRQVPAADALRAAARLQPLYIAAALAGAGRRAYRLGVGPVSAPRAAQTLQRWAARYRSAGLVRGEQADDKRSQGRLV